MTEENSPRPSFARVFCVRFWGSGGEMQFQRLNREDLNELKGLYEGGKEGFLFNHLNGGEVFSRSIHSGCFGVFIDQTTFEDEDGTEFSLEAERQCVQCDYVTDEEPEEGMADYFYLTFGEIHGTLSIPLDEGESFDPSKLICFYTEYSFDGYAEEYGKIMVGASYRDKECTIETEDDGQELRRIILMPRFDEKGQFLENDVLLDQNRNEYTHIFL